MITRMIFVISMMTALCCLLQGCQGMGGGGSGIAGNEGGTAPINEKETVEYQRAILKCYKTGGSRIVKIEGELRCY